MSVQVFLQGQLVGSEDFLLAPPALGDRAEAVLYGRAQYVSLLGEVLPRALLRELGLAPLLLGASGGDQFLIVLPEESRAAAEAFLASANQKIAALTGGALEWIWAVTENLGEWPIVRKRLTEEMRQRRGAPVPAPSADFFAPFDSFTSQPDDAYFAAFGAALPQAERVSWTDSARMEADADGRFTWPLTGNDALPLARHVAQGEDGNPASAAEIAARAQGQPGWGVLIGDVDQFAARLRMADSIEEHIELSILMRQFFLGELQVLCSMPDYWRKTTILVTGSDDFAVLGSWDALLPLAREIQRVFQKLAEVKFKDAAGLEGRTITMALEMAGPESTLVEVYAAAVERLAQAKTAARDSFSVFGRALEWKQMGDAADLRATMMRLLDEFHCAPQFLNDLQSFYRESGGAAARRRAARFDRPWRFHRRLNRSLDPVIEHRATEREFQKVRTNLITEFIGKNAGQARLRPAGRVALEWARRSLAASPTEGTSDV